ncbi:hypothetical protein [Pseudomonas huanghezhanensis]|uniref:hypothetical protein n=1 Tax=Pseudomonas huanghezhanensis TaxID=3002903 RepID=UPI00228694AA|nr:hypothetical protein [Pseudomonas sp. BSw22131]
MSPPPPTRQPCPPGACDCERERLVERPDADLRILWLTRAEEKRLLERLESIASLDDLKHMQQRMHEQLGIRVDIAPGFNEVKSVRGLDFQIAVLPGMCRKTRKAIPTSIRRALEKRPEIAYQLLNAHDLLRDA